MGITNQGVKVRWYKHCSDAIRDSLFPIHHALRKYGFDNFTIESIETCSTVSILKEKEKYWIKKLDSRTINGKGYNLTDGGDGTFGRVCSEKTRDKLKLKALERDKISEETKLKMSLNSTKAKKVSMFDLNGKLIKTFRSVTEAGKELKKNKHVISACARGSRNKAYGYKWSYTDFVLTDPLPKVKIVFKKKKREKRVVSDEVKKRISETNKLRWDDERKLNASINNHKNKPILQYDLQMNYITEFRNVAQAAKSVGASTHTNIAKCARGFRKSSCGFIWRYKE